MPTFRGGFESSLPHEHCDIFIIEEVGFLKITIYNLSQTKSVTCVFSYPRNITQYRNKGFQLKAGGSHEFEMHLFEGEVYTYVIT